MNHNLISFESSRRAKELDRCVNYSTHVTECTSAITSVCCDVSFGISMFIAMLHFIYIRAFWNLFKFHLP